MKDWTTPDAEGNIHVPDAYDKLVNSIGIQMNFVLLSDKNPIQAVCDITSIAEKFFVDRIKHILLQKIEVGVLTTGESFEGVAKSIIEDLDALVSLS
jgi:hypothetical protein